MRRNLIAILSMIGMVLSLVSCSASSGDGGPKSGNGIELGRVTTSLDGENTDVTEVSYSLQAWNRSATPISLISVEPVVSEEVRKRLMDKDLVLEVGQDIENDESLKVTGTFSMDTTGMTKEEITKLEVDVQSFKLVTEQEVSR